MASQAAYRSGRKEKRKGNRREVERGMKEERNRKKENEGKKGGLQGK